MLKVHILVRCTHCDGQAYIPAREAVDANGNTYIQHNPCLNCQGSGTQESWIDLTKFASLLGEATCTHKQSTLQGAYYFNNGDVWDDIKGVCHNCGANLDKLE